MKNDGLHGGVAGTIRWTPFGMAGPGGRAGWCAGGARGGGDSVRNGMLRGWHGLQCVGMKTLLWLACHEQHEILMRSYCGLTQWIV